MYIVESYSLAIVFCFITMLGWGSWANTLKLSPKRWEFPLYYWDYSIGLILTTLLFGFTLGSAGQGGRSFLTDLGQADATALGSAFLGGVVFNIANLLVVAATAIAGMSVAFPIAVGLALVIGVVVNYIGEPLGNPYLLFGGTLLVVVALLLNARAYAKLPVDEEQTKGKGILISVVAGVLMGFFYRFVADAMADDFVTPQAGQLTPYSAMLVFTVGIFLSNFVFNTYFMYRPIQGGAVSYGDYFRRGTTKVHLIGIMGGVIWCAAMEFNLIASGTAGPAISYGLGQGATMIAAFWGVFVWKEFAAAKRETSGLLTGMFVFFILGLVLIVAARNYV
jgi:glucose uptake protein